MLTHSTNPRGGVVHAMELSEALQQQGHAVTLFAPDASGQGFFRSGGYAQVPIACDAAPAGMRAMVEQRIADYVRHFTANQSELFELYHAHDGISGNAMATLTEQSRIPGYARTVHHLDEFEDAGLNTIQARSILCAERVFCVSRLWQKRLAAELGIAADLVPTGIDRERFSPHPSAADGVLRKTLGIREGVKVFLSVGGIEPRKNSLNILKAFASLHREEPDSQLIFAGGATLLDHSVYAQAFWNAAQSTNLRFGIGLDVVIAPQIADDQMPSLFRLCDALVFASIKEGFGLVVLEAAASGTPIVLSKLEPFTEYMPDGACIWMNPYDPAEIASAMRRALEEGVPGSLRNAGLALVRGFSWGNAASVHSEHYRRTLADRKKPASTPHETVLTGGFHA